MEADLQYHTYTETGTYIISMSAFNSRSSVSETFEVKVQHAVTDVFLSQHNSPVSFSSGLVNITLYYPANLFLPQAVIIVADYGESSNYPIETQLDWMVTSSVTLTQDFIDLLALPSITSSDNFDYYPFNFLYTYQTPGLYDVSLFLYNLASNVTYNTKVFFLKILCLNIFIFFIHF